jgi:uncharacterized protein (TIGR02611 family)
VSLSHRRLPGVAHTRLKLVCGRYCWRIDQGLPCGLPGHTFDGVVADRSDDGARDPAVSGLTAGSGEGGVLKRAARSLRGIRAWVSRRPGGRRAWRVGVAVLGLLVIVLGVVLLVIPGPGWVVIFLGLSIWATEFRWARSLLIFARRQVGKWTAWIGRQPRWLAVLIGGAGLVVVGVVVWWWLDC